MREKSYEVTEERLIARGIPHVNKYVESRRCGREENSGGTGSARMRKGSRGIWGDVSFLQASPAGAMYRVERYDCRDSAWETERERERERKNPKKGEIPDREKCTRWTEWNGGRDTEECKAKTSSLGKLAQSKKSCGFSHRNPTEFFIIKYFSESWTLYISQHCS